jgi:butyryl-CoA dehydrogenase
LQKITGHLLSIAPADVEAYLSDATLYLEFFGIVTIAWQWLKQATIANIALPSASSDTDKNFYQGKIATAQYFFEYELVKTASLSQRLKSTNRVTIRMQTDWF